VVGGPGVHSGVPRCLRGEGCCRLLRRCVGSACTCVGGWMFVCRVARLCCSVCVCVCARVTGCVDVCVRRCCVCGCVCLGVCCAVRGVGCGVVWCVCVRCCWCVVCVWVG